MSSSTDADYPYFVRTSDSAFWEDRELVKSFIEMYQLHGSMVVSGIQRRKTIKIFH